MSDHRRKLTLAEVEAIRSAHQSGETISEIAVKRKVSVSTVWKIVRGFSWKLDSSKTCPTCHQPIR